MRSGTGQTAGLLEISVAAGDAGPVIALSGEADMSTLAELDDALAAQVSGGARHLTLDLSGLRFADSASIRTLDCEERGVLADGLHKLTMSQHRELGRQWTIFIAAWTQDTTPRNRGDRPAAEVSRRAVTVYPVWNT